MQENRKPLISWFRRFATFIAFSSSDTAYALGVEGVDRDSLDLVSTLLWGLVFTIIIELLVFTIKHNDTKASLKDWSWDTLFEDFKLELNCYAEVDVRHDEFANYAKDLKEKYDKIVKICNSYTLGVLVPVLFGTVSAFVFSSPSDVNFILITSVVTAVISTLVRASYFIAHKYSDVVAYDVAHTKFYKDENRYSKMYTLYDCKSRKNNPLGVILSAEQVAKAKKDGTSNASIVAQKVNKLLQNPLYYVKTVALLEALYTAYNIDDNSEVFKQEEKELLTLLVQLIKEYDDEHRLAQEANTEVDEFTKEDDNIRIRTASETAKALFEQL